MDALDVVLKRIQAEAEAAIDEALSNGFEATKQNVEDFYSQGQPRYYQRTGQLGKTPESTGVSGHGNHYEAQIWLNGDYSYNTGTYSGAKVLSEAEMGGSGILGKPGFWEKSEEDIKRALDAACAKRFD